MTDEILVHPIQHEKKSKRSVLPQTVTMKAYEVYCELYGKQEALVTGGCRGGFSTGEVIGFLYAATFPKKEWAFRVQEAFRGMSL